MLDVDTTVRIIQKGTAEQRYTLGVVYEPDSVDLQGDRATADTIEKACWDFNRRLQQGGAVSKSVQAVVGAIAKALTEDGAVRVDVTALMETVEKGAGLDDMHGPPDTSIGTVVESYILPCPWVVDGVGIKKGAWLMGVQWSPDYFQKVKKGERTGLSMGGTAIKVPDGA